MVFSGPFWTLTDKVTLNCHCMEKTPLENTTTWLVNKDRLTLGFITIKHCPALYQSWVPRSPELSLRFGHPSESCQDLFCPVLSHSSSSLAACPVPQGTCNIRTNTHVLLKKEKTEKIGGMQKNVFSQGCSYSLPVKLLIRFRKPLVELIWEVTASGSRPRLLAIFVENTSV